MVLTGTELTSWVGSLFWPFMRFGAMLAVAPIFGARTVPVRVRLGLALLLALILVPVIPAPPVVAPLSAEALVIGVNQVLIGLVMGFLISLVFGALVVAGHSVAMGMGLGFASMVDPQNGVQVPVLSQFYVIIATLIFLALDGHLVLIGLVAESFQTLPIGMQGIDREGLWGLVGWGSRMFAGGVLVALPAMIALKLVNLSFGVVTRAAPQLNIFAVGFPVTMLVGFVIVMITLPSLTRNFSELLRDAFTAAAQLTGG